MDFRDFAYQGMKAIFGAYFYAFYNPRPVGNKNIPKPAILASNHITYLDPLFIIAALHEKDPIHFVAMPFGAYDYIYRMTGQIIIGIRKEYFRKEYYRKVEEALNKGRYLGIFCEGERSFTGELGKFHDGAASIALRTQVPIVPIYIHGAYDNGRKFPSPFRNVEVRFGSAIEPPKNMCGAIARRDLTRVVKEEIERLAKL